MADDIGFGVFEHKWEHLIQNPVLDSLALNGINFTNAISQPLCTPSRVKIMTESIISELRLFYISKPQRKNLREPI